MAMAQAAGSAEERGRSVVLTVFLALLLDLLAFTLPLPLFPRLIAWYLQREALDSSTLLSRLLALSYSWRHTLLAFTPIRLAPHAQTAQGSHSTWSPGAAVTEGKNWDVVLLGGAMGSLFSLCQCLISPWLGALSDRYGRKRVLLATMLGNILSAAIWLRSTTFTSYLLSRLVGGLSEGNVQLSTAIISDVTKSATRSKSLALVGIAFSICFTLGPSLGAYFASRPLPLAPTGEDNWNVYALPAAISLLLLLVETGYLALRLPETRQWRSGATSAASAAQSASNAAGESVVTRMDRLQTAGQLHGLFLLFFSGAEFTLTFLTYDLFAASNAQNGRLLSYIGILSALLQARHVRPALARKGELRMAGTGIGVCAASLAALALLPFTANRSSSYPSTILLYSGVTGLAYTSATVVTSLTAAAASCCDEDDGASGSGSSPLRRGRALGRFRSRGQLGRAVGPLLASSVYWTLGPTAAYAGMAALMAGVSLAIRRPVKEEARRRHSIKAE